VAAATGKRPPLPARLADLLQRAERRPRLPNALGAVEDYVRKHAQPKGKGAAA
jgi:threonine synthase